MSESLSVINLLESLLPRVEALALEPMDEFRCLYAGIGMPSLRAAEIQPQGSLPYGEMFRQISDLSPLRRVVEPDEFRLCYLALRERALADDCDALNDLGWLWLNGRMLPADHARARRLFKLAATAGSGDALFNLAEQYYYGKGVAVDLALAAEYYQQAYEQGIIPAAGLLGPLYQELSEHESVAPQLIAEWFRKGAEDGDLDAGYELGCYLLRDDLPIHDEPTALYWLQHVALRGYRLAAERLAEYFQTNMSYGERSTRLGDFWLGEAAKGR
ncbi:hypothetical protein FBY03_12532 [Pseudomonas sp. SJZ079]|uniref:tetratricopeptide repeat protein n=1 Tax=Pseudomonas sp. SJZ079 TaxID=2572887 RepID=UPI00119A7F82|nr:tetratricopeptide repeat protein [Pseudomonas sp. SJZ079]TWC30208.1 hypothetical protein FBY03_12532 [Pseudomonas sp. SJZ079]